MTSHKKHIYIYIYIYRERERERERERDREREKCLECRPFIWNSLSVNNVETNIRCVNH